MLAGNLIFLDPVVITSVCEDFVGLCASRTVFEITRFW